MTFPNPNAPVVQLPETLTPIDPLFLAAEPGTITAFPNNLRDESGVFHVTTLGEAQVSEQAIDSMLTSIENAAEQASENFLDDWKARFSEALNGLDSNARSQLQTNATKQAESEWKAGRDAAMEKLSSQIDAAEAKIDAQLTKANRLLAFMPTPFEFTEIHSTLTEADVNLRAKWDSVLAHASYGVLLSRAIQAISGGNYALAAAVSNRLRALQDKGEVTPVTAGVFTNRFCGQAHGKLVLLRDELAHIKSNLTARRTALVTGKKSLTTEISAALRERRLAAKRPAK